ncbi:MAG: EpsI family protein [Planctomycetes bacterium]|nr:EpsI family protein [Planctomycetota bacterium]
MPATPAGRGQNWWVVLAVAAIAYVVLDHLDGAIALPLRELSTVFAAVMLDLVGYPITRAGTILSTDRFTFDVVPACSGSTTLRVLLVLAVIWCGSHPRLHGWRRLAAFAAAAPLALLANAARVAALVALGDLQMRPVEGVPHVLVGLCTFVLALSCLFLLCEALAGGQASQRRPLWRGLLLGVIGAVLMAPTIVWCVNGWITSPLDHFGWALWIVAGGAIAWSWRRLPRDDRGQGWGVAATAAAASLVVAGTLFEINSLQALGLCAGLFAGIAFARGRSAALRCLPAAAILVLGMPVAGFLLTRMSGFHGPAASLTLRCALTVVGLLAYWWLLRRERGIDATPSPVPVAAVALLALGLAMQTALVMRGGGSVERLDLDISYIQGAWVGSDLPISTSTAALLGRDHRCSRAYRADDRIVELVVTSTGGDRHRMHPPEYCLTGAGWSVVAERTDSATLSDGTIVTISGRSLTRADLGLELAYWFSDGRMVLHSYQAMLAEDSMRRVRGVRTDWILFRVLARDRAAIDGFLAGLAYRTTPAAVAPQAVRE